MPVVPILTSARGLAGRGEIDQGPGLGDSDWAELVVVEVDDDEASWAGSYWSYGYAGFLEWGDTERLDVYRGVTVGGYPLVTDPDLIEDFYYAHGHVDFQEYYQP
jgi:hypothetical protein